VKSPERVFTALDGGRPDRVPALEFIVDETVWRALAPDAVDMAEAMDRIGFDGVGCGACFRRIETCADGSYTDEWGVTYKPGPEAIDHPVRGPIRTLADAKAYEPPDPDAPHRLGDLPGVVERFCGRRAICFHHRAAFMWSAYLMGMEDLLVALLTEPDLATTVLDKVLEANMAVVRRAIRAGAQVIILGDDYAANAGPLFSPDVFGRFIVPRLAQMIRMIHDEGARVIKHSDGNIYPILDELVACGPDGLNPIEPVAGMSLAETRRRVGESLCLCGNIDCGDLLSQGTPDQVRAEVRRAIADGGARGAFILTSSNSIHSSCRPQNVQAMLDACREFGAYDTWVGEELG
jgi:uroporphyrinogen decarboxylase